MRITVFGGSQARPGSATYAQAETLGGALARRGHTVLTGGYMGVMEAVSKGASEAGGHVIGVTCDEIARWHGRAVNSWVKEEHRRGTLIERLGELIHGAEAAIAMPGGPGTLTEVALMWNLMIVGSLPLRPLILMGTGWRSVMDAFFRELDEYVPAPQRALLRFAPTVEGAVDLLT